MWSSRVVARSIAKMRLQGGNRSSNAKVSAAGIRLDSRKIYRAFNGIFCDDISEFESSHPSQAVASLWAAGFLDYCDSNHRSDLGLWSLQFQGNFCHDFSQLCRRAPAFRLLPT